jgi:hypothetical protein
MTACAREESELLTIPAVGTSIPGRRGTRKVCEFPSHKGLTLGRLTYFRVLGVGAVLASDAVSVSG